MSTFRLSTLLLLTAAGAAVAQTDKPTHTGPRPLLPRAEEIPLARSAAPAGISKNATVYVLVDTGYVLAERGTNGNSCYVSRSWLTSVEPHCFDAEGAATIMRIEMHEVVLRHLGRSEEAVAREIGEGISKGTFRLPRRPVMSWMMSEAQQLQDPDTGAPAGNWKPHVMIYYPHLTSAEMGFPASSDMRAGMVSDEGEARSNLMFIMPAFVKVVKP